MRCEYCKKRYLDGRNAQVGDLLLFRYAGFSDMYALVTRDAGDDLRVLFLDDNQYGLMSKAHFANHECVHFIACANHEH